MAAGVAVIAATLFAQTPSDPFPAPIGAGNPVVVSDRPFARLPDVNGGPPRMMLLTEESGTRRFFVNDMGGRLFSVGVDGRSVTSYLDLNDPAWSTPVQAAGSERGFQSFAFHPQFAQAGARGYGKFYTYTDTSNTTPAPDFRTPASSRTHDTVLLEWTARHASASTYDGGPPREIFRAAQPYQNHNGGHVAFNPLAVPGSSEFGLLYVGLADGGSGGDPMNLAQNLGSPFGKILRIDPLGTSGRTGKYGVPASNPFAGTSVPGALGEIYAYGLRNPQRFSWDSRTGTMYVADIGQNIVEEVSPVAAGANLGWNRWEGSFAYSGRQIRLENPRGERGVTFPVVEFDHHDPLLQRAAVTGVYVYRDATIPSLRDTLLFGDNPSGEIFVVPADPLPNGGQHPIRRVLLNENGSPKTLLQLIREQNRADGRGEAPRADLRFGTGSGGRVFVLNKRDGIIRELTR